MFFRSSSWFTALGCGSTGHSLAAPEAPLTLYGRKTTATNMILLLIKPLTIQIFQQTSAERLQRHFRFVYGTRTIFTEISHTSQYQTNVIKTRNKLIIKLFANASYLIAILLRAKNIPRRKSNRDFFFFAHWTLLDRDLSSLDSRTTKRSFKGHRKCFCLNHWNQEVCKYLQVFKAIHINSTAS